MTNATPSTGPKLRSLTHRLRHQLGVGLALATDQTAAAVQSAYSKVMPDLEGTVTGQAHGLSASVVVADPADPGRPAAVEFGTNDTPPIPTFRPTVRHQRPTTRRIIRQAGKLADLS